MSYFISTGKGLGGLAQAAYRVSLVRASSTPNLVQNFKQHDYFV